MSENRVVVDLPADAVFRVLADAGIYDRFVPGTKRIRSFEPSWPAVGSAFHHTIGVGPLVLRDLTTAVETEVNRRLVLRAQMRPLAVNRVTFDLRPVPGGTEILVEEYPLEGPAVKLWNPVLDGIMWLRNREMLRRLERVAQQQAAER